MKKKLTFDLTAEPLRPSDMMAPLRETMSRWNITNPCSITLERQGGAAAKLWCAQLDQGEPFVLSHEEATGIMYWRKPVREEAVPLTRPGTDNSDSDFLYLEKLGMDEHSSEEEADAASVRAFFCYLEGDGYDGEGQNVGLRMLEDGCAETMDWLARCWVWLGLPAIDPIAFCRISADLLLERLGDLAAEIRHHKAVIIQEK
jgi:hypothetical protein